MVIYYNYGRGHSLSIVILFMMSRWSQCKVLGRHCGEGTLLSLDLSSIFFVKECVCYTYIQTNFEIIQTFNMIID